MSKYLDEIKNDPEFRHLIIMAVNEAFKIKEELDKKQPEKDEMPDMMSLNQAMVFCRTKQRILKAIKTGDLKTVNCQGVMKFRKVDLLNFNRYGTANVTSEEQFQLTQRLKKYKK